MSDFHFSHKKSTEILSKSQNRHGKAFQVYNQSSAIARLVSVTFHR